MKHTNNPVFSRLLALVLCFMMLALAMTACSGGAEPDNDGTTPPTASTPPVSDETTDDNTGDGTVEVPEENPEENPEEEPKEEPKEEPEEEPVDPN